MNAKIKVLFYLRKSKVNAVGKSPIFLRVSIDGKRLDSSTGIYVEDSKWSSESAKIKGHSEEARTINGQLEILRIKVFETEKKLHMNNIPNDT